LLLQAQVVAIKFKMELAEKLCTQLRFFGKHWFDYYYFKYFGDVFAKKDIANFVL
jgi:hypothetical protein